MNVIKVLPINNKSWSPVGKYANCHDDHSPYWPAGGSIYTGLDKDKIKELQKSQEFANVDLSPNSPYWETFFVRLGEDGITLNLDDPNDKLKYYFLLGHKDCKPNVSVPKAGAKFVIIDEKSQAKHFNLSAKIEQKAIIEYAKLSIAEKRDLLRLYNIDPENLSDEVIEMKSFEEVKSNPTKFVEKFVSNIHKESELLISRAMGKGIIQEHSGAYFIGTPKDGKSIGHNLLSACLFLENESNEEYKINILKQIA